MKLYATTTSERASKGQGGNKEIRIDLYVINRDEPLYEIVLTSDLLEIKNYGESDYLLRLENVPKGKQKKDEIQAPSRSDWKDDGKDDTY